jgi:hypothetical protein
MYTSQLLYYLRRWATKNQAVTCLQRQKEAGKVSHCKIVFRAVSIYDDPLESQGLVYPLEVGQRTVLVNLEDTMEQKLMLNTSLLCSSNVSVAVTQVKPQKKNSVTTTIEFAVGISASSQGWLVAL